MPALYEPDLVMRMEDVESMVVMANSDANPFIGLVKNGKKTTNKLFSWGADEDPDVPVTDYADGVEQTDFVSEQPDRLYGMTQEMREGFAVGRQAEAESTFTKHNDPVVQKKKALKRLYRQLEVASCSAQEQRDATSSLGSRMRGAFAALSAYGSGTQVFLPFAESMACTAAQLYTGATGDWDDDALERMLVEIASRQKESTEFVLLCGIQLKRAMSNWVKRDASASGAYNVSIRKPNEQFIVDNVVDVFKMDGGTVRSMVSYNLMLNTATGAASAQTPWAGLLIQPNYWKFREFFGLELKEIEDKGQGKSGFYRIMKGLQCSMPRRNGYILPTVADGSSGGSSGGSSAAGA